MDVVQNKQKNLHTFQNKNNTSKSHRNFGLNKDKICESNGCTLLFTALEL